MGPCLLLPYHFSHLSLQNLLDHANAFIMPSKMYFGDLNLHGHSANFSLV